MEIPIISTNNSIDNFLMMFKHYFSNPQYRDLTHYVLGIILCEGKRTTAHITRSGGKQKEYNRLHHFITDASWNHQEVNQQRIDYFTTIIEHKRTRDHAPSTGFLIVDDTTNPKRGKHMPGYGFNYSSVHDEAIPSQSIVTTLYHYDTLDIPLHASLYKGETYCAVHKELFKTKNDLFEEQLEKITMPQLIIDVERKCIIYN